MNVELLQRVKQEILAKPRKMDMAVTLISGKYYHNPPPCQTVGCIAGWAAFLSSGGDDPVQFRSRGPLSMIVAKDVLRIDNDGLFYVKRWPSELREQLDSEKCGTPGYARVVAEAIDLYIVNPDVFESWDREED